MLCAIFAVAMCASAGVGVAAVGASEAQGNGMTRMIEAIVDDARRTRAYTGKDHVDERVLEAVRRVPREAFVPETGQAYAYENVPLPIGHGQTISQPFIVALMTDLLALEPTDRVLEIGTGSGYQAAILGELVESVFTIEIIPELAESAAGVLADMGYANVQVRSGDGWHGWPEQAPFDAIIVTAVAEEVPPRLFEQLAPTGRLVLPLGPWDGAQMLTLVTAAEDGGMQRRDVLPVQFVPLTGDH